MMTKPKQHQPEEKQRMRTEKETQALFKKLKLELQEEVKHTYLKKLASLRELLGVTEIEPDEAESLSFNINASGFTKKRMLQVGTDLTAQEAVRRAIELCGNNEVFTWKEILVKAQNINPSVKKGDVVIGLWNAEKVHGLIKFVEKAIKGSRKSSKFKRV